MDPNKTSLERAFELVRSGGCRNIGEIRSRLNSEGYTGEAIRGGTLIKQLRHLIQERPDCAAADIGGN